jgi:hypothetical protein
MGRVLKRVVDSSVVVQRAGAMAAVSRAGTASSISRQECLLAYEASGYDLSTHPAHLIRRAHQRATFYFQQVTNVIILRRRSMPRWLPYLNTASCRRIISAG